MNNDYIITPDNQCVQMSFSSTRRCISNAPLGGGLTTAEHFINYKVPYNISKEEKSFPPPDVTLSEFCKSRGIDSAKTVGMMTAADMETFVYKRERHQDFWIDAGVTVGLGNARRAGEESDYSEFPQKSSLPYGTINIAIVSNIYFSDEALIEAVALCAEAKAATLYEHKITSSKSDVIATGTGTDAVAIFAETDGLKINYCGKHVLAGQMLARAVMSAISEAIEKYYKIVATKHWMR